MAKGKNLGYYALALPYPALCAIWYELSYDLSNSLFCLGFFALAILFFFSATEIVVTPQKALAKPLGINFLLSLCYTLYMELASVLSLFAVPLFITTFLVYFTLNLTREAKKKRNNPPTPWTKALLWFNALPYPLILYLIFYSLERTVLDWLLLVGLFLTLLLLGLGAYGLYKVGNRLDFLMSTLMSSFLMLFFVFIFETVGANTYPKLGFLKEALFVLTSFTLWLQCFLPLLGLLQKRTRLTQFRKKEEHL